jgi:predicted protein tyrosine phosphatase
MTRTLFLCNHNRLRSPTAQQVVASWPGVVALLEAKAGRYLQRA